MMCKDGMCGGGKCIVHKIAAVLLTVGGLNWGLVGLSGFVGGGANWNLVNLLLGSWPMVEWAVYVLVGISAIAMIFASKCCMKCDEQCCSEGSGMSSK